MYRIRNAIQENAKWIDSELNRLLDCSEIGNGRLADAMRYSVQNGGKRIRAFLVIEFCRMFNGSTQAALPYAAAIEFGHTASLIHDDMPCMDNDDIRRGKPSCHMAYDEHTALLAGDALLSLGFEMIISNPHVKAELNQRAASEYARNVGVKGMCSGQQMDLDRTCESLEQLYEMYCLKTGLPIKISATLGCLAAGIHMDEDLLSKISQYALNIGKAYQIIDDLIDAYGVSKRTGKPVGSDEKNGRITALSFITKEEAEATVERLLEAAAEVFEDFSGGELLCQLPWFLKKRLDSELAGFKIGKTVLNCFEAIEPDKRYDFIKKLTECYAYNDVVHVFNQFKCPMVHEEIMEVLEFLEDSKYVKLRRYKNARIDKTFPWLRNLNKSIETVNLKNKKVVIVGAGLSGAMCGYFLQQAGANVLLIESADISKKQKLCGGILSKRSKEFLLRIFGDEIQDIFRQDIETVCFYQDKEHYRKQKKEGACTVVRKELDDFVLNKYISLGGAIKDRVLINGLDTNNNVVKGIDINKHTPVLFDYDVLVAADGARSMIRKTIDGKYPESMFVLEAEVPSISEVFVMAPDEIKAGAYGYAWYIPQGDRANIGCGYAKWENNRCIDISAEDRVEVLSWFSKQLGIEKFDIKGAYLPVADIKLKADNIYFIGDAAGLINTQTGEGICYALASAEVLKTCMTHGISYEEAMEEILEEIKLLNDSHREFYEILAILMNE